MHKELLMKRFLPAVILVFVIASACTPDKTNLDTYNKQIDSAANARIESLRNEMKAKNDSIINAMARKRADSILKSTKR